MTPPAPDLSTFFEDESLLTVLRKGHPYDARGTYALLRAVYGYRAAYVNYGWWPEGPATDEPGRRLCHLAADALALPRGGRLLDVGAGLGQAAVDLAERHDLALVAGVNRSARQVAFARALAASQGLEGRVRHVEADACAHLASLEEGTFDGVLALECAGHLPDPDRFLEGARRALAPGGRIAMTLNVARRPPGPLERALLRASYGFVPAPGEAWAARLSRAGFAEVERRDITAATIGTVADVCLARLADPSPEVRALPRAARAWVGLLLRAMRRAVRSGALGYERISARRPPATAGRA